MKEYLHIEDIDEVELPEEVKNEETPSLDDELEPIEFLHKYVSTEITENDLDEYYDDINYFTKKRLIPKDHNLINEKNEISFLAIVASSDMRLHIEVLLQKRSEIIISKW